MHTQPYTYPQTCIFSYTKINIQAYSMQIVKEPTINFKIIYNYFLGEFDWYQTKKHVQEVKGVCFRIISAQIIQKKTL